MLILITPPETEFDEQNIWTGNLDTQLSNIGKERTKDFARNDLWIIPSRIFCSPATHMIEFISLLNLTNQILLEGLTDRSMGTLSGRGYRETMDEFPRRNWLEWRRNYWNAPPSGESLFDISDRVLSTFQEKILPINSSETVMIVCSPDIMRLIIGYITAKEESEIPKIVVESLVPYVINGDIVR